MAEKTTEMTLLDHLAELRKRLVVIVVVNIAAAMVLFQFTEKIMAYILNLNPGMQLVFISPSELFLVYIQLAFILALILCSPITVFELWAFVGKGLYKRERTYVLFCLIAGMFFFAGGVYFAYTIVVPVILQFFMRIAIEQVAPMISVQSYAGFINTMLAAFGLVFEMPVLAFLLAKLGILKPEHLRSKQRILIVVIFILSAIITPPDVASQMLMAVPMLLLFELSIGICMLVDKSNKRAERRAAEKERRLAAKQAQL